MRRFGPFVDPSERSPEFEIEVKCGSLSEPEGETVYEPEYDGIGQVTCCARRRDDGMMEVDFGMINEQQPRLRMMMAPDPDRIEITITPVSEDEDTYLLSHAIMIAYMLATAGNGTLLIHASAIMLDGKAYLFQGKSGTGKSTHSSLWLKHIPGAELLNDDHPVIRIGADGRATAYGSPWSGKTHCYRNEGVTVGAFVRIVRGSENELHRLSGLKAYASLTASMFYLPFLTERQREVRHRAIERLAATSLCCEMHCRPDADAAVKCRDEVVGTPSLPRPGWQQ